LLYIERDGRRVVVVSSLESERIREAGLGIEVMPYEAFGLDELMASGTPRSEASLQMYVARLP